MGLAANPCRVLRALSLISVTTRTGVCCRLRRGLILLVSSIETRSARVAGARVRHQRAHQRCGSRVADGSKCHPSGRSTVDRQGGLQLINAVMTRVFGRRVAQRRCSPKPSGGLRDRRHLECRRSSAIRNRTLRYLTDQAMDSVELVDVQVVQARCHGHFHDSPLPLLRSLQLPMSRFRFDAFAALLIPRLLSVGRSSVQASFLRRGQAPPASMSGSGGQRWRRCSSIWVIRRVRCAWRVFRRSGQQQPWARLATSSCSVCFP